ncbi:PE-PPE domain-containing protein [Mycobacterium sp. WMMD1722]|uniref:PE-PPE domain-containing protein n=1 Tax=Mycobacterium sp. WMMD1722 TaxID=3404117 RepID=UPI003BF6112A
MRRSLAAALAAVVVGTGGALGTGVAVADPAPPAPPPPPGPEVVYALGGARAPGIPWRDYTARAGAQYFPGTRRDIVDYPAGAPFSWVPEMFLPPGGRDRESIGEAATIATHNLDQAIRAGSAPAAVVGLSQGTLALDQEQARLAGDPHAPPPDRLSFTTIGNPTGRHAFGASFLSGIFPPGSYLPLIDYTMPPEVDSQYDTDKLVATYDGLADFPDRPDNLLSVANATVASAIVHTPAAFTGPGDVPPQNIRSTVNSRGARTTTYLIPVNHLPLTLPLRYLGLSGAFVDQIDSVLQPIVDAGYSRYDDPRHRPVAVDPARGMDPIAVLDPQTRGAIEDTLGTVRDLIGPLG